MRETPSKVLKRRRSTIVGLIMFLLLGFGLFPVISDKVSEPTSEPTTESVTEQDGTTNEVLAESVQVSELASTALETLEVKGRAPKTGYSRSEFGDGWATVVGCDMRNRMLQAGMTELVLADNGCVVLTGTLNDPYTAKIILFTRGTTTSDDVQIDHMVALSDAWQKGAQDLSFETRVQFANDPLNLLAVDGPANQQKSDGDAATWLPANKDFRCRYVARQIAVKQRYHLWVTDAEKSAMKRVLNGCESQVLPDAT